MPVADAHCRVSNARCKPCTIPHDITNLPRCLPAGLTQHVLNNYTNTPPLPRHRRRRLRTRRAFGGRQDFQPPVRTRPGWNHHRSLQNTLERPPAAILATRIGPPPLSPTHPQYWAGAPLQLRQANRVYRRMRVGAAHLCSVAPSCPSARTSVSFWLPPLYRRPCK